MTMLATLAPPVADATPAEGPIDRATLRHVAVIDDDEVMLLSCRRVLEKEGYEVEAFSNPLAGLERMATRQPRPQLVLVDLKMPELDGLQVIARLREIDPRIVIAVITGYATIATVVDAMSTGAHDFLPKPFTPDELRLVVRRAADRWRLMQEAEHHRREREVAERRIVTFVSHQLKSPLAASQQLLDVLMVTSGEKLPPNAAEWIGRVQARLRDMTTMIDDWLTLARLERGLCEANATACLCDVAREVITTMAAQAARADVRVAGELPPGTVPVRGDRASVTMLVSNLVSNAVKYNRPGGRVAVRIARTEEAAALDVADTGIGIDAESLPHVFDEFYRAAEVKQNGTPGNGLGLAICRRIVSEIGGTITVTSNPGTGTTFSVRLPLALQQAS